MKISEIISETADFSVKFAPASKTDYSVRLNSPEQKSNTVKLGDLAEIHTNFPDADFWIRRVGDEKTTGKVLRKRDIEMMEQPNIKSYIGIKVTRTDVLDSRYLSYLLEHLYNQGYFKTKMSGMGDRVNIKVGDISNIQLKMP